MNNNNKRRKAITKMVLVTLLAFALLVVGAIIYSETGICWPVAVATAFLFLEIFLWLLPYYHKVTAFVCPECNKAFKPTFTEMLFALHTPTKRKLTCHVCGKKHWCKETFDENSDK